MKAFINKEACELRTKFNEVDEETSKKIVRWAINRYTGRAKIDEPVAKEPR